jgi:hypothetical protein
MTLWKRKKPKIKLDKVVFRVGKLTIRPGDILVLRTELLLDKEQISVVRERAAEQFKDLDVKIVVVTAGMEIAVLRKEDHDWNGTA